MLRPLNGVLVLLMGAGLVSAQSLADAAAQAKERRARINPASVKAYSDEDLKQNRSRTPSAPPLDTRSSGTGEDPIARQEAVWRSRAKGARDAVLNSERRVAQIQAQIGSLQVPLGPIPVGELREPLYQQHQQAKILKAEQELESAKAALAQDKKAYQDLEEEARRTHVPSGWLREP